MDLRIQKTKNSIFSAFIELRAAKPLEKITIRELTQKANISKQTFYLHFKDIYDLVEWSCYEDASKALQGKKTYETWQEGYLRSVGISGKCRDHVTGCRHSKSGSYHHRSGCRSQTALYRIYYTGTSVQHSFPG